MLKLLFVGLANGFAIERTGKQHHFCNTICLNVSFNELVTGTEKTHWRELVSQLLR